MNLKIVFMGSPDFAVPILRGLVDRYSVVGVITQPDRPAGRGQKLTFPPVKNTAMELGLDVIQPSKLHSDITANAQIQEWDPDVIVVAAFGQILKPDILNLPPHGCINIHASLLPKWRGVTPIQAAILNGDKETGVTIMKMDTGIDTGEIISQRAIPIESDDTGGSLFKKLALLGKELLIQILPKYTNGEIIPIPQGESPTPYTRMLIKEDGKLDFNQAASTLSRQVRAYNPWPGTFTIWDKKPLKIHKTHAVNTRSPGKGFLTVHGGYPAIGTADGILVIDTLQPAGKNVMSGDGFLRGARNWEK